MKAILILSIDVKKFNPFERKTRDLEFRYEPGHFVLLTQALKDLCDLFSYSEQKDEIIQCFDFWIKFTVDQIEITKYTKDNSLKKWNDLVIYEGGRKFL